MRKGLHKKVLASLMAFALAVPAVSISPLADVQVALAADDDVLDKVLGADDITLRIKWNDKSNVGTGHSVTMSDGSTITVKDNGTVRKELTASQLANTEMGIGINLGNTLEARQPVDKKASLGKTDFDLAWGQPVTTREYINFLHSYGINTLRIPVSWSNGYLDDGSYTIRGIMLDRVEEVANYALDNGMYVIINEHWDNQWFGQFGACKKDADGNKVADEETRKAAWERYEKYWTQISERFKNYSDHLIFEGANEELGTRLNDAICLNGPAKGYAKPDDAGDDIEVLGGNLTTDELYKTANEINQKFVDIVRKSGGNNTNRHLLIPGYDTDIEKTSDERFVMPKDIAENGTDKLFLSVHYYTPWDFCGDNSSGTYTVKDQEETAKNFEKLKKFNDAGYAVIVGECGICEPDVVTGSVTQWFHDTFTEAGKYNAVPVIWDRGNFFERTKPECLYKDMAVFFNTINGANGDTSQEKNTGCNAKEPGSSTTVQVPDYIDSALWGTPGIHAYLSYQTSSWDYRDSYKPLKDLDNNAHSWEYIQAAGSEVKAADTKVTDVQISKDGEYTVAIEGIDLSAANSFNTLSISTDINKAAYPGVTITDAVLKVDGAAVTDAPVTPVADKENDYYKFLLINKWTEDIFPLTEMSNKEEVKIPSKNIEITFKISGLEKVLADVESGEYVNPETGTKLNAEPSNEVKLPEYIDSALWQSAGIHSYLTYQTASWDYRNSYKPLKDLGNEEHSWDYAQASGSEVNSSVKITDIKITSDGEYTVAIEGADLSGANSFNVLGISTDIKKELYPGITVTDAVLKIDGAAVNDTPLTPVVESDDDYYKFMLVNKWGTDSYPLAEMNENEKIKLPAKSMEITFKINGLTTALADIASGEYINNETGQKISGTNTNEPGTTEPGQPEENKNLKKGDVFTSGNFKYKVTKVVSGSTDGNATLTGLSTKGSKAKKLSVALSVKGTDGNSYKITAIGKKAFSGAKATAVTLNKNIKNIPALAFQNCTNLNTLTLKAKLSKAAKNSFKGCKNTITVKGTSGKANKKLLKKTSYKKFK